MTLGVVAALAADPTEPTTMAVPPVSTVEPAPPATPLPVRSGPAELLPLGFGHAFPCGFSVATGIGLPPRPTRVTFGSVVVTGEGRLDRAIVRRYLRRQHVAIAACFAGRGTRLRTRTATFVVTPHGAPAAVRVDGNDRIAACVTSVLEHLELPSPRGELQVSARFTFTPEP